MKKPVVGLALGLFALLFMLSSAAWAVSANEHYQVNDDVQSDLTQITQGNLLSSNEDNKQTLYTPLNGGAADGQWLDFVEAWQLAAEQGGAVTLQQDVLVAADVPEGIFVQVPEDGQVLLNLNGHRLIGEEAPCLIFVGARGKLTVMDSEQGGGQIVGVVGVDDSAEDENEWGQIELLGGEIVDPNVAVLLFESEADYISPDGGTWPNRSFKDAWNKAATDGGTVRLLNNVTADSNGHFAYGDNAGFSKTGGYIVVPANANITLDLNGWTLNRNLSSYTNSGQVIDLIGTLTITDTSDTKDGVITGGYASVGGGICLSGTVSGTNPTLIMEAGTISGNNALDGGGGVFLGANATFTMSGGKIENNSLDRKSEGGGIYVHENAKFNVSGNVSIKNNKALDDSLNNVCLVKSYKYPCINVKGGLAPESKIGVFLTETPAADTVIATATDASYLVPGVFDIDNDGFYAAVQGKQVVLAVGTAPATPEAEYTPVGGTAETGTFVDMWNKAATGGGTVKLLQDVTAVKGSFGTGAGFNGAIKVPGNVEITLDLAGNTIDRGLKDGTPREYGVIWVYGTLNLNDSSNNNQGLITGGNSPLYGGGILIAANGTLNMSGGRISGNKAGQNGGGVFIDINGKFKMTGGTITGNSAASNGGGVFVRSNEYVKNKFAVSGEPVIENNTGKDGVVSNVYLNNFEGSSNQVDVHPINIDGELNENAHIGVSAANAPNPGLNIVYINDGVISGNDNAFFSDNEQYDITKTDNRFVLHVKTAAPHKHPLNFSSGNIIEGGEAITFNKKLTSNESNQLCIDGVANNPEEVMFSENITGYKLDVGNYYLAEDITIDKPIIVTGDVNLCLNGKIIQYSNNDMSLKYRTAIIVGPNNATLNLCDCQPEESHIERTDLPDEIHDLTGGIITGANGDSYASGIRVYSTTATSNSFNLYSGTIAGNTVQKDNGGGVYNSGTFNMYGGKITQNSAESGGGVYLDNIGIFNIHGGEISNNNAKYGGGVYNVKPSSSQLKLKMDGGIITQNVASSDGGGIYSKGSFRIDNGEISGNTASSDGGGVYMSGDGAISLFGGKISNNTARRGGGVYTGTGEVKVSSVAITGNYASNIGGGFYAGRSMTTGNTSILAASFSDNPQIYDNKAGSENKPNNFYLINGYNGDDGPYYPYISITTSGETTLKETAKIGVSAQQPKNYNNEEYHFNITSIGKDEYKKYEGVLFADNSENCRIEFNTNDKKLYYYEGEGQGRHIHVGNLDVYQPLSADDIASGSLGDNGSSKYYYLTSDITLTDTITIEGDVNICLNGHKITGPADKPAFKVPADSTLKIYNCKGENFSGLKDSGGIEVAGGGRLEMIAKNSADNVTYAPAAGSQGGKVTVDNNGIVTKPSEEPTPGETHAERHPELAGATPLTADSIKQHIKSYEESGYTGTLPDVKSAYDFLDQGTYYMEEDFTLNKALVVLKDTTYCLNGNNFGADNETWLYELGHVFWVPEKAVLNVLDCQRNLHIIWLYGGRVFLKNGGTVNMTDKDGWQTKIESTDPEGGFVKVEQDKNGNTIMTLPDNTKLTQKDDKNEITQTITNNNGVLEITTPQAEAPTKITPPSADASIDLKLPEAQPGEELTPDIVLDVPADSIVQTGEGPEIKLEQPGEVAADGTVSSPEVTVTITDPETKEEVQTTIAAPAGKDVQVNTDGQAQAPVGSTVKVDDVVVKIEEIGGGDGDEPDKVATVSPNGDVQLPPGKGSQVTVSSPEKGGVTIVIALPDNGGEIGLGSGGGVGGGSITPPKGSDVTVKNKDDVTIVIALPWPEDGKPPHIDFGNGGTLILPPGTEIKVDGKDPVTVDKDNPVFNPETGELTDKEPENKPSEPVNPNEPTGETEDLTPDKPVETPDAKVEMDDKGEITITPTNPEKPAVVIKPQPQDPDKPGATPKPPVVDETGKVFIDDPFKVETENGPDITADKGGSVDPDGNVTGEKVTVEQKNPDGTENKTTLTAPDNDAVKVSPEGEAQAPVGTEVENEDVTVKIDKVPDSTKPVPVKPDGSINLPGGSEITVTPQQPEKNYTVKLPEQGGEVKLNPDKTITLPPGSKVVDQNGKETTISNNGGTLNPSTGAITGAVTGGSSSGGGGSSSASYVITASASIGGEISPDKRVVVSRGADQTFTIKPADGYVISDVLVDGKSVGQVTSYTFENVRAGHSIQALFVAKGMSGHGHQGDCPKDETCPIWPYSDSIPTAWYHDGVHYCIEYDLMIGTAPALWEPNIPFSRAMMAQVLYNKAGRPAVSGEGVFDDVDQEWYWPAITWGGLNKVLWGYGDGNYGPEDPITREQLATLLWRYAGQPETSAQLSFTDAAQTSDYAKQALAWASQHGVITGYPDGTFQPQGYTSRAEAAQMIMRYFNL